MFRILEAMVRWLAPIVSFTAEEIWQYMPGARGESVLFETLVRRTRGDAGRRLSSAAFWADLLAIREVAAKQMEVMRANREIGASLEAEITLYLDAKTQGRAREVRR